MVRVREFMIVRDLRTLVVKIALPEKKACPKWNARAEVDEIEEQLQ